MRRLLNRIEGSGEAGLTIIEVIVAALILALGAAATFGVLSAATKNAQRAKASQVALDLAQEEMERLRGIPYDDLALSSSPTPSSSEANPNYRVEGTTFALQRNPVGEYGPLVMDETGATGFSPQSEFFSGNPSAGGVSGTVYRYVVWRNDDSCPDADCPGTQDYKQIVVAVQPSTPASQTAERGYVEVQSGRIDPDSLNEPTGEPGDPEGGPGGGSGSGAGQQFYLSDTPCAATGSAVRATIGGDHLLHNTLGTCASGLQTGSGDVGAPDALLLSGPPDPDVDDPFNPALYDYSNDFYLEPTPDTDKGLQIRRDDTAGCHYDPTGTTSPEAQAHRWVSDRLSQPFSMTGTVTLEFYTRTLNDGLHGGGLCVYLFERSETAGSEPKATDTRLADKENGNLHWLYEPEGNGFWPRNTWTKVRLTMEFSPEVIDLDNRLGVALTVDPTNTLPADAIPIMYDHPNYPTRLEVDTTTPIAGG
jgi:hypothetical protein